MLDCASFHRAVHEIMARAGDTAILPRLGRMQACDQREKSVDELVTIADHDSERILAEGLHRLLPQARIVGEEAADADPSILAALGGELCWIIDPLDGTANFAAGEGPFGILVALAERGEPVGGWIYDPRSRRFCSAARGAGAFIDGERVMARPTRSDKPVASVSTLLTKTAAGRWLADQVDGFTKIAMQRCAAEQYPRMVLGSSDVSLFGRTLPWDHAAGVLFLVEAGGKATRFDGSPYRVDDERHGLVAAVSEDHWAMAMAAVGDARL